MDQSTDSGERSVEGAVDVYMERLARLVEHGMQLPKAKLVCMHIAQVWLDENPDRAKWEPQITEMLAKRIASIKSKADLDGALKRDLDAATKRDTDAALARTLETALAREVDAALKRDLEAARQRVHLAQLREATFTKWFIARLKDFVVGRIGGSRLPRTSGSVRE